MTPPTRESQVPTEPGWYLANVRKRENEDESDLWLNDPMEKVWVHWQPDAAFPVQVPGNGFTADWVIEWGPSLAELLAKAERTDAAEAELLAARSATPCGNPGDGRPAWCPVAPSAPLDEFAENRWRKKPVVITARRMRAPFGVHTLEGHVHGRAGDWCITGVEGESYPCADRIFRATYERADEPAAPPVEWVDGRATVGGLALECVRVDASIWMVSIGERLRVMFEECDAETAKRGAIAVARAMG